MGHKSPVVNNNFPILLSQCPYQGVQDNRRVLFNNILSTWQVINKSDALAGTKDYCYDFISGKLIFNFLGKGET